MNNSCCDSNTSKSAKRFFLLKDPILYGSLGVILVSLILYGSGLEWPVLDIFAKTILELLATMWWGILLGLVFVGLMSKIPREYFRITLGKGEGLGGIIRAAIAGLFLDLCSHGILMVGAKLYERGASVGQVMTFLIASPWNSISLTFVLIALIGLNWTLLFIAGSALIAILSGLIFNHLTKTGRLPQNPNASELPEDFDLKADFKKRLKDFKPTRRFFYEIATGGKNEAIMLLRWLLLGVVLAAAIRAFVPPEYFTTWFGPTLAGLLLTLVATTIIEVCSEGSAPIASELLNQAGAPGNAFTFLMAGVATDYTEIMVLRDTTESWKVALALPLVTVPQVLVMGWIMNLAVT